MVQTTREYGTAFPEPGEDPWQESLEARAAAGCRDSFQELVTRYQDRIFRMIFYRVRSTMEAQDLTQEVFLTAFRNLSGLERTRSFQAWLFSIALNRVRDHARKKKVASLFKSFTGNRIREEENPRLHAVPGPESTLRKKEFWALVERLMEQLTSMEREVFMLRFFDHLGIREISIALNKGESTVKTHLYKALTKIRQDPDAGALMEGVTR